ncbi:MAG: quinolinate synthase NadA [Ruminococcus sp.]|nr:quinolinate synthase NadA [Ruminococcus sp.]
MLTDVQQEILRLKKEKDFCILAHCYQTPDILEIADFTGDSFALSTKAMDVPNKNILMCGVRFMAETVKIFSPEKHVYLSKSDAGCPMAEQLTPEELRSLKAQYPEHTVVAYVNTTSALKTLCDVCVTSSSAVQILKKMPEQKILFIPDCNLGDFVQKQVPDKEIVMIKGGCPVHGAMTAGDVMKAKAAHPDAKFLVHPECPPEVTAMADYAGSTTGIMDYAVKSEAKSFIIGTENSIVQHLQLMCPDKMFYPLSKRCVCHDMKLTTLVDVLNVLKGTEGEEILMDEEMRLKAKGCMDRMLELGQ